MSGGGGQAQAQQTQSWGDLNQLFGVAESQAGPLQATGMSLQQTGVGELDQAAQYWQNLLTGNRTAVAGAVAPVANAARASADTQKNELAAAGTGRTGGAVAGNQEIDDKTRAIIDSSIAGVAPKAAEGLTQVGGTTAGIGATDISAALQSLGIASGAAGTAGGQSTQENIAAQQAEAQLWSSIISGASSVAAAAVP
jgi:hypothetical protein